MPSYRALEPPHRTVHENMRQMLDILRKDWHSNKDLQQKMAECFETAESASDEIGKIIDRLVMERRKHYMSMEHGKTQHHQADADE